MSADITLAAFVELALKQGAAGLFAVFIFALLRGWVVVGDQHREEARQQAERYEALLAEKDRQIATLTASRDRWERIALQSLKVADAATGIAEQRREAL